MNLGKVVKRLTIALVVMALLAVVGGGIVVAATSAFRGGESAGDVVEVAQEIEEEAEPGIVVASVDPDGPAAAAGVVRGDILLAINGEPVDDTGELGQGMADLEAGDQVQLTVLHGDDERTLTATLAERNGRPYLGIVPGGHFLDRGGLGALPHVEGFLNEMPKIEGLPFSLTPSGATITSVVLDSPADAAGLNVGDIIVAVDGQEVNAENGLADLIQAHDPGATVTLEVERSSEESLEVTVALDEHPENAGMAYLGVEYAPSAGIHMFKDEGLDLDGLPFGQGIVPMGGGIIASVAEGSPAEGAGLQAGDRITKVDGVELDPENNIASFLTDYQPGDTVTLEVERPGEEEPFVVNVVLGEHPEKEGAAYLGIRTLPFGDLEQFRRQFGHDELPFGGEGFSMPLDGEMIQGAVVREVTEGGPAERAGLSEGDVITQIDGEPVAGPSDVLDAIADHAPGDAVTLTVYSTDGGEQRELEVTLAEHPEDSAKAYLGVSIGGFMLHWDPRHGEGGSGGMQSFREFFEQFRGRPFGDQGEWPFEFEFPPGWFEQEPVQPDGNTL
jgi:S1-C subfamily serine protease